MTDRFLILSATISDDASDPLAADRALETAEAAMIDLLLLGEEGTLAFDSLVLAGWLAPRATTVGLVPMVPTGRSEPFHIARALSALDFLTGGCSGWHPVAGDVEGVPLAEDFVAATRSLWDSWDADALIIDQASGLYLDPDKVRRNDHRGPFFKVLGPLNAARPPQGYPVLVMCDKDPLSAAVVPDVLITDWGRMDCPAGSRIVRRPDHVIDVAAIEERFRSGALDGVHLTMEGLLSFVEKILPELVRRGLVDPPAPGASLRSRLQLPVPANPFASREPTP